VAGPLLQWLHNDLVRTGFSVVLLETRRVRALSEMVVKGRPPQSMLPHWLGNTQAVIGDGCERTGTSQLEDNLDTRTTRSVLDRVFDQIHEELGEKFPVAGHANARCARDRAAAARGMVSAFQPVHVKSLGVRRGRCWRASCCLRS
jgi:hypothetical protein